MLELLQIVGIGLVMLLPLVNPLATVVLFLGLSSDMSLAERRRQIAQTAMYVFAIMAAAFYGGQVILDAFGISIPGLRIGGGLIIALVGLQMLFGPVKTEPGTALSGEEHKTAGHREKNIAFVPLAMPGTAGPGTISMLISTAAEIESGVHVTPWVLVVAPGLTFLIASFILWICLRSSGWIMRGLGATGIAAIERLMGFLLVCLGVQFMINGTLDVVTEYARNG